MLTSVARVVLPALGAVAVVAAGAWLAAVGVTGLVWLLGFGGCLALGLLLTGLWGVNRTVAWLAAFVFWATMVFPVVALGRDIVLAARGQWVPATVAGYRHVAGVHTALTYTKLRTRDGRYVEVSGSVRSLDDPVTVVVDPAGAVAPQAASDVTVGSDLGWSVAGLVLVLGTIAGFGISGERDRRRGPLGR